MRNEDTIGGYTPSKEEIKKTLKVKGELLLSGDKYFNTIQGEGPFIGRPMMFIRLQGCNFSCKFCDTPYSFRRDMKEYYEAENYSIDRLVDIIGEEDLVITGGEPLLQSADLDKLITKLDKQKLIQIETNGTIVLSKIITERCEIICSPKMDYKTRYQKALMKQYIKVGAYFKFVCKDKKDFYRIDNFIKINAIPIKKVYIMPEGINIDDNIKVYKVIRDLIIDRKYNTTPRLQNIMWDGAIRGV